MCLRSLYTIKKLMKDEMGFSCEINFDPSHEIFSGHFPGQAVVPGVCLIHIVKEIAGMLSGKEMLLKESGNIKFLNVIDPAKNSMVHLKGTFSFDHDSRLSINTSIIKEAVVYFKFKGTFETS